ncbi:MAG: hypothetical protein KAI99_07265 [Cyclobacteriaceae bacterium]|nr:hypothetical protein [Cyclobacteriaceae bacterium]
MKTLRLYFIISATFIFSGTFAQDSQRPGFLDKVFVGGGFGAGFGNYTYINISPIIGYRVTPKLSAGLRLMYQYTTFDYYDFQEQRTKNYQGNDFGVGGFARFMVYGPVYLQAEYEHLNYDGLYTDGTSSRDSFDSFMAGGGIAQPVGGKAFLFITAMYNFSYENFNNTNAYRSPYNSPWVIRIGITAGF